MAYILAFQSRIDRSSTHEFNYCLFCWLTGCVCVRSVLTGITIKYTQHSDMWQNYKTKPFFSLQHLRWIHNPPKQKSSKTAVCTRRTVYLWIGYDLTVDDHLYASKPKQKTRTIREARLYGTQRHKKIWNGLIIHISKPVHINSLIKLLLNCILIECNWFFVLFTSSHRSLKPKEKLPTKLHLHSSFWNDSDFFGWWKLCGFHLWSY